MTVFDSFAERCLRFAARRWPADMRDDQYREWTAEMHMIRNDVATSMWRRTWRQLRFAFSLAASPPADDENRVPRGWRELVPYAGHRVRPWAALAGMGVICALLAGPVRGFVLTMLTGGRPVGDGNAAVATITSVTILALAVALAAWLGAVVGRRLPLLADPGNRAARVVAVVGAPITVGMGVVGAGAAQAVPFMSRDAMSPMIWLYAPLIWMALFATAVLLPVRLARRGRSGIGRGIGVAAGVLVLEVVTVAAMAIAAARLPLPRLDVTDAAAWFPMSVVYGGASWDILTMAGVSQVMPSLVVASGFVLWYAIASCRARVAVPEPTPRHTGPVAWRAVSRPRTAFALTTVTIGLAAWATGVAFATPAGRRLSGVGDSQFTMWASELRQASIVVVCLGLGMALVGRGRPFPAVAVSAIALLITDTVLDAFDRTGLPGLAGAVGFGTVILAAAWWLGRTMLIAPPRDTAVRRGHVGIATTAALCAPFILVQSTWPETASQGGALVTTPVVFPVLTTVVTVSLATVAGVSAMAARRRRVSTPTAVSLIGVPAVSLGGCGVVSGWHLDLAGFGHFATVGMMLALPFTVWILATMWWDRARRRLRAGLVWAAIALAGVPATLIVIMIGFVLSTLVGIPLMAFRGSGYPADGVALLPGVVVLAIGLASSMALFVVRAPRPAAVRPEPAGTPHDIPGGHGPRLVPP